jgi:hypothetical protein
MNNTSVQQLTDPVSRAYRDQYEPEAPKQHRRRIWHDRRVNRYAPALEDEIRRRVPGDDPAAVAIRASDGNLATLWRKATMHMSQERSLALLQAKVDELNAIGWDVVLRRGNRGPSEGMQRGRSAHIIIYHAVANVVKRARRALAKRVRAAGNRGEWGVGTVGAENVQVTGITSSEAVSERGYRDGAKAQSRILRDETASAPETVTVRIEHVSKQFKSGLYRHFTMTTDGLLYGFYGPRQEKGTFVDAQGTFGALKKTKDGDDIVYMRGVTITPRKDILDDGVWTTMAPDGKVLFYDVPAFSPWHPADENTPLVPVPQMADEPFVPFG